MSRVLLIDDEAAIREFVRDVLADELPGCQVSEVGDRGAYALVMAGEPYDLVITDYQLGWTDGLAVLREVKARWPECLVIMFTGTAGEQVAAEAMKAGLDDYIIKPKHVHRLPASVAAVFERKAARRAAREAEGRVDSLLNDVLDTAAVGLMILDARSRIVWVNATLERFFGVRREEILGQEARALVQSTLGRRVENGDQFAARVLQPGKDDAGADRFECHVLGGDGLEDRWLEHRSLPIRTGLYAGGRIEHYYDITDRTRLRQVQAREEILYRLMVESSEQVMFYVHDRDHRFTYLSPSVLNVLGYAPEELVGRRYDDLLAAGPGADAVHERTDTALRTGERSALYEAPVRHKDGRPLTLEITENPIRHDGEVVGLQGFARDVTPRKQAEQALRESEARLRSVIESATDLIAVVDDKAVIQFVSPSVLRMVGRDASEMVGRSALDFVHPDDMPRALAALTRSVKAPGTSESAEFRLRDAEGRWRMLDARGRRVTPTGKQTEVVVTSRDITERLRVLAAEELINRLNQQVLRGAGIEEMLRTACTDLLTILDVHLAAIASLQPDGDIRVPAAAGVAGVDAEAFLQGLPLGAAAESSVDNPFLRVVHTGTPYLYPSPLPIDAAWLERIQAHGVSSLVASPLRAPDRLLGVLLLLSRQALALAPDTMRLIERLGARISLVWGQTLDQQRLRLQNAAMTAAANAIFITDRDGRIQWVNEAFTRMSGYTAAEALGQTPRLLKSGQQGVAHYRELWQAILAGRTWRGEIVDRHKNGQLYTVDQTITPLLGRAGEVTHLVAIHEDITDRKEAEARILHIAQHDALTDLPNRVLLRDRLEQAIARARRSDGLVALLFMDLDRFKLINDSLGHEAGDLLLKEVARRLRRCIREGDTVARLGGDEFTILLPDLAGAQGAIRVADAVLGTLRHPMSIGAREIFTAASIGIVLYPSDAQDPESLTKAADTAMYRAKQRGGNRYEFFTPTMETEVRARLNAEEQLRRALDLGQFVLHYQPRMDLRTGAWTGLEALLRWRQPTGILVAPASFIQIAEETGLIIPLGEWVVRTASCQARTWQAAGLSLPVSINLSARQFRESDLVDRLRQILAETGLSPDLLELELTESIFLQDVEETRVTLARLSAMGLRLLLDDFGTGYSSLAYLRRFPISALKIDRSFVQEVGRNPDDEAIVRTIIAMAKGLRIRVVAEGVETDGQRRFLLGEGCDAAQGHLFSPAVPADAIPGLLQRGLGGNRGAREERAGEGLDGPSRGASGAGG